jgi:hypothetical protein
VTVLPHLQRGQAQGLKPLGRLLAWIQIGGGSYGVYSALQFLTTLENAPGGTYGAAAGGLLFYVGALVAGFLLLRSHAWGVPVSIVIQAFQIPAFVINDFIWSVSAGPRVVVGLSQLSMRLMFDLASYFHVGASDQVRELIGINVLACFWTCYLLTLTSGRRA